jgi:cytochrome c oxidase subunit 2
MVVLMVLMVLMLLLALGRRGLVTTWRFAGDGSLMSRRVRVLTAVVAATLVQTSVQSLEAEQTSCVPPPKVGVVQTPTAGTPVAQDIDVIEIVAERFSFTPSEIRLTVGMTVELRIRSQDTMHGFRIVGRNVDVAVPKRRMGEAVVVFDANEVGRYRFDCTRLCGAGHNFMQGEIVVTAK